MSRTTKDRLLEILSAITAVRSHLNYGGLDDLLVWDAVCNGIACCRLLSATVETVSPIVGHSGVVGHDKFVPPLVAGYLGKLLCLALLGYKLLPKRCRLL